jgi:hypothetical protein
MQSPRERWRLTRYRSSSPPNPRVEVVASSPRSPVSQGRPRAGRAERLVPPHHPVLWARPRFGGASALAFGQERRPKGGEPNSPPARNDARGSLRHRRADGRRRPAPAWQCPERHGGRIRRHRLPGRARARLGHRNSRPRRRRCSAPRHAGIRCGDGGQPCWHGGDAPAHGQPAHVQALRRCRPSNSSRPRPPPSPGR